MDKGNFNASHFAWCGLIAIHIARRDGLVNTPAQENLFISRWLATAEKQCRFPKEHANDIRWLLKESREKVSRRTWQVSSIISGAPAVASFVHRMTYSDCSTHFRR